MEQRARVGARYGVNVIVTNNGVGVVGGVGNVGSVGNALEDVRSKVWAMTGGEKCIFLQVTSIRMLLNKNVLTLVVSVLDVYEQYVKDPTQINISKLGICYGAL